MENEIKLSEQGKERLLYTLRCNRKERELAEIAESKEGLEKRRLSLERRERMLERPRLDNYSSLIERLENYTPSSLSYWLRFDTWDVYSGIAILNNIDPASLVFDEDGNIYPDRFSLERKEKTPSDISCVGRHRHISRVDRYSRLEYPRLSHIVTLDGLRMQDDELSEILEIVNTRCPRNTREWQCLLLNGYYNRLTFWKSGNHTEDRYPPKYFIDWAISKGMKPKWLDWAKENGLIDNDNKPEIEDKEPTGKSRTSFQNAMAALFNELLAAKQEKNPKITKTALIQRLTEKYSGVGITESFLTRNINEGQKTLQSKQ